MAPRRSDPDRRAHPRSGRRAGGMTPRPPARPAHPPVDAAELQADFATFREQIRSAVPDLTEEQLDQVRRYGEMVVVRSALLNLVSPGDRARIFTRHIGECLAPGLVAAARRSGSLVDIGSGAGLPGLPLAIASPGLRVLLVEPRVRRAQFLEATALALGLGDRIEVFQGSAERLLSASGGELGSGLATARAVDRLQNVGPWAAGLLRSGGELVMYRAPGDEADAIAALVPPPAAVHREVLPGLPRELLFLRKA
jgi:16S rRNA G527 N7-methylase RsmG